MELVLPQWAKQKLVNLTVTSVSETFPHTLSIRFSDGSSLVITGMPFAEGTIDAQFIEGISNEP
jgi:hypothetical protein